VREKGSVNVAIGVLGVPGTGKTTRATVEVLLLQREIGPVYVVAHDPGYRIPDTLPNGVSTRITRHDSVEDAQEAMKANPGGIHAIATVDASDVIVYGSNLSKSSLEKNGGKQGIPTVIFVDEAVSAASASPYRLGEEMRELLALRRHKHVGIVWTSQSPQLCHYQMLSLSTKLVLFRITDGRALARLEQAGVPPEITSKLSSLPDHSCYVVKL
jgi:hypothetical protein